MMTNCLCNQSINQSIGQSTYRMYIYKNINPYHEYSFNLKPFSDGTVDIVITGQISVQLQSHGSGKSCRWSTNNTQM